MIESEDGTLHPWSLTRVMKRGNGGHNSRVMRSAGHGKKNTRLMNAEDGDAVDARLVKRGKEENKYVRVMRKANDLDGEIQMQRVQGNMDGNVFERILVKKEANKNGRKYDQMEDIEEDWATKSRQMRKEENQCQRLRKSDTRMMRGNTNRPTLIRFLRRTMKRQDEVAFSRGMLTRVG